MAQLQQAIQVAPPRSAEAARCMPHHGALPGGPGLQGVPGRPRARAGRAALILEGLLIQRQRGRPGARLLSRQNLQDCSVSPLSLP